MKKSLLFVAVVSLFALASCGGEKHEEVATADTTVSVIDTAAAVIDSTADSVATDSVK